MTLTVAQRRSRDTTTALSYMSQKMDFISQRSQSMAPGEELVNTMIRAVQDDDEQAVIELLNSSGNLPSGVRNHFGATLLMLSIEFDSIDNSLPQQLLAKSTDEGLAARDAHGDTAFLYAVRWGDVALITEMCASASADPAFCTRPVGLAFFTPGVLRPPLQDAPTLREESSLSREDRPA